MTLWLRLVWLAGALLRPKVLAALVGVGMIAGGAWLIMIAADVPRLLPVFDSDPKIDQALQAALDKHKDEIHQQLTSNWHIGGSKPKVITVNGSDYWSYISYAEDGKRLADEHGNDIIRHCAHVFAIKAKHDGKDFVKEEVYTLFGRPAWPERVLICESVPVQH